MLYKLLFALILKLYGTIRHTLLKTWLAKSKNLELPWGLVLESGCKLTVRASAITTTRNWARYWRAFGAGFQKENLGFTLTCTILVLNLVCTCTARDKTRVSCDSVIDTTLNSPYFGSTIRIVPVPKMFHFSTTCVFSHMQYYGITTMRILSNFGDTTMRVT